MLSQADSNIVLRFSLNCYLLERIHASGHRSDSTGRARLQSLPNSRYCKPPLTILNQSLFFDHLPAHQGRRGILHSLRGQVSFKPTGVEQDVELFASTDLSLSASAGFFPIQ